MVSKLPGDPLQKAFHHFGGGGGMLTFVLVLVRCRGLLPCVSIVHIHCQN